MDVCFGCFIHTLPIEKLGDQTFLTERLDEFYPFEEYHGEFPLCPQCAKEVIDVLEILK